MKEKVKALWKLCFTDSDSFTDLYFSQRYNNDINIAIESGEEVISALQMIPYPMTFAGQVVQTAYVSGACTHPDYRNKGVMRELLGQTFTRLWKRNIPISTLIPAQSWLFNYYTRLGYAPVFRYTRKKVNGEDTASSLGTLVIHTTQFNEKHYQYLQKKLAELPCAIQHTADDYKVVLQALALSRDAMYVALQNDRIAGLAVVWKEEYSVLVDTFFAENKAAENSLLYHIYKVTKQSDITVMLPSNREGISYAMGMIRIVCAKDVLSLYAAAHPEMSLDFELIDKQLSVNNGYYRIMNGQCYRSDLPDNPVAPRLTVEQLAQKLFATDCPYMGMMLND